MLQDQPTNTVNNSASFFSLSFPNLACSSLSLSLPTLCKLNEIFNIPLKTDSKAKSAQASTFQSLAKELQPATAQSTASVHDLGA